MPNRYVFGNIFSIDNYILEYIICEQLKFLMKHRYSTAIKVGFPIKQNYKDFELEDKISTSKWNILRLQKKHWRILQDFLTKGYAHLQSE